jgi:hypothetical protein
MENLLSRDLNSVRTEFDNWRAERKGKERIPEYLWESAIRLLDYYSVNKISRELRLSPNQLQKRSKSRGKVGRQPRKSKRAFLEVRAGDLVKTIPLSKSIEITNGTETTCRIVLERADGSRLSLNLPVNWTAIESICSNFSRV